MKVFAFLMEPASYTVSRNLQVYIPMGIDYCYLFRESEAKNTKSEEDKVILTSFSKWKQLKFIQKVLRKYDIIIFNGYTGSIFLILFFLNLWYGKPIGINSDTQYREPTCLVKKWIKCIYLNIIFSNKHFYGLAGGNFTHKDLFRKFGMPENRIMLMPMVVDNSYFSNPEYKQKTNNIMRFMYVGRLVDCKNIDFMIKAFLTYHNKYNNSELHIIGKGYLENAIKSKYDTYGCIFFDGPKYGEELLAAYMQNHVLILPSLYEPWGLVVNEAMSAGIPVLVSNEVGAHYDLVDGKDTGIVFDPCDETSLINAMEKVSQVDTYKKYAENAYSFMHNSWNYSLYRKCLEDFINTVKQ